MSTAETLQTVTTSSSATEQLAERLASNLHGGEVIELVSDLGGGKTTFVRGLARGLGSKDHVSSPTFTINQIYKGTELTINHYDFYRLGNEAGLMQQELQEALQEPDVVTVIEWGQAVGDLLPDVRLTVSIRVITDDERKITFSFPKEAKYLLEGVC